MKNYYTKIWTLGLVLMALISFNSCMSEDSRIGDDLAGRWYGDWDMYSNGEHAIRTELEFVTATWSYDHGTGYQKDYYSRHTVSNSFTWEVSKGVIYLKYNRDRNLDCAIVDYNLTYNYFSGCIADYNTLDNRYYFNLRNAEHYNESSYDPYYVKAQRDDIDSVAVEDHNEPKSTRGSFLNQ